MEPRKVKKPDGTIGYMVKVDGNWKEVTPDAPAKPATMKVGGGLGIPAEIKNPMSLPKARIR